MKQYIKKIKLNKRSFLLENLLKNLKIRFEEVGKI